MSLSGGQIAGGNPKNERVKNDFYATNPLAVQMLFDKFNPNIDINTILEPCVGNGLVAKKCKELFPAAKIDAYDIVDRGYPNTIIQDFLTVDNKKTYDLIITNPPFSLAKEFAEHSIDLLNDKGLLCLFLKIEFLESEKRKVFFEKYPPKYIYVFSNRMSTWNNGNEIDPKTGKKWSTVMCHAWFIWEKNCNTEPIIRWL